MTAELAKRISRFLKAHPDYRSWERLPDGFLEEIDRLDARAAIDLALAIWEGGEHRYLWAAYTALHRRPAALRGLRWRDLKRMGDAVQSWWAVDALAALAGPAWREGRISDYRVEQWTRSPNRWWRRTALVCTVCLNRKSLGGEGDAPRTLAVCEALVADRDDMVVKALSWALRDLSKRDRRAVERFLAKHEEVLAARVKREVRCKLETGRKSPRRG